MTGVKVVDAPAFAALVFAEPEADAIAGRLFKTRRDPSRRDILLAAHEMAISFGVKW